MEYIFLYVTPSSGDLESIVEPLKVNDNLVKIIDERGYAIEKIVGNWENYIGVWQPTEGYSSKVKQATTLNIMGTPIPLPLTIPLTEKWNIISYPSQTGQNALSVVEPLIDNNKLIKVIDEAGMQ